MTPERVRAYLRDLNDRLTEIEAERDALLLLMRGYEALLRTGLPEDEPEDEPTDILLAGAAAEKMDEVMGG